MIRNISLILLILASPVYSIFAVEGIPPEIIKKVDSLFIIASSGEVKYQKMVQPAIDSIAALGTPAVPRLIEKYDTQDARERLTINNILVKIGKLAVPYLLGALNLDNAEQVSRICYTLGEIRDSSAVSGIINVSDHYDWRVRSDCAGALGKIGDHLGDQTVLNLLLDTVETVRKSAAVSSGQLKMISSIPLLVYMLGDNFYGARLCASEALVKFGDAAVGAISDSLNSADTLLGNLGCTTLGLIGTDSAIIVLHAQIHSENPMRRIMSVEAMYLANNPLVCGFIELAQPHETDSTVLFYMNKIIDKYDSQ
jgi:HEAT repeat protein